MGERAQVSMEYLLIMGFALMMLLPIIILAFQQSSSFSGDVTRAQLEKIGSEITGAVDAVYYAGPPTTRTFRVFFPEGISSIDVQQNAVVFTASGAGGRYEYAAYTDANITGTLDSFDGIHVITITAGITEVTIADG